MAGDPANRSVRKVIDQLIMALVLDREPNNDVS
jgi:hypothetical protein